MAEIYRALEPFAYVDEDGNPMPVAAGTLVSGDSRAYKGRESYFETVEATVTRATETATAGPGEMRSVGHKKAPAKKASPPPASKPEPDEPKDAS